MKYITAERIDNETYSNDSVWKIQYGNCSTGVSGDIKHIISTDSESTCKKKKEVWNQASIFNHERLAVNPTQILKEQELHSSSSLRRITWD